MNTSLKLVGLISLILFCSSLFISCTKPNTTEPNPPAEQTPPTEQTPTSPIPELKVIQTLFGHESNATSTFSVSSEGVVVIQKGNYVHFIDSYTGILLHTEVEKENIVYGVRTIVFSPDGNLMVKNHSVGASVWNVNEQTLLYTLDEHISSFSTDGKYLNSDKSIFHSETGTVFFDRESYLNNYIPNYNPLNSSVIGPVFSTDRSIFAVLYWIPNKSIIEVRQTSDKKLLQTIPDISIENWESPLLRFNSTHTTLLTSHTTVPFSDNPTSITKIWQIDNLELLNSFTEEIESELIFHPNNNLVILSSFNNGIRLVDLKNGEVVYTLPKEGHISKAFISPDGSTLILNRDGLGLEFRNVTDGKLRYILDGFYSHNFELNYSPDNSKFTINHHNENVIYQLSDGKVFQRFSTQNSASPYNFYDTTGYDDFQFMPDNTNVLGLRSKRPIDGQQYDDVFKVFKIGDGSELSSFTSGPNDHAKFTLSSDGTLLSSFGSLIPVHIWDLETGALVQKIMNQNPTSISEALISPDNKTIVTKRTTVSNHNYLDFWKINSKKWLFEIPTASTNYSFSSNSKNFYTGTDNYTVETTNKITSVIPDHPFTYSARNSENSILITSGLVYNGAIPYTYGDFTRDLNIWKLSDGQNVQSFANSQGRVSQNGELLAMFDYTNNSLELRQVDSGQKIFTLLDNVNNSSFYNYENFYYISGFSSDSSSFFYQTTIDKLQIWDTDTGQLKQTIQLDKGTITKAHISPDGSFITLAIRTGIGTNEFKEELSLWRTADGVLIKAFDNLLTRDTNYYSVEFSPDGKELIIGLGHTNHGNTITVYGNENNDPIFLNQGTN